MSLFGFADRVIRAAAVIVPSGRRDEWRAEWRGELSAAWRRSPDWRVLRFALGAISHAVAEWWQEWNLEVLSREARDAVRAHIKHPSYSLTAALLIALGVGANTTVFTLVNAILLRAPRGIEAPERLVQLGRTGVGANVDAKKFDNWSYPLFTDFRSRSHSFTDLAAYETVGVVIGDDADAANATAQLVSPSYFRVLGAPPQRGRGFVEEDNLPGAAPVAIISDALWRGRYGADGDIVGKTIRLRGALFRIVGVAASNFTGAEVAEARPDFWVPVAFNRTISPGEPAELDSRFVSWIWIVGRLKPGVDVATAGAEMKTIYRGIQMALDDTVRDDIAVLRGLGLRPEERAFASTISGALLAMVAVVLLVACANLAGLLLARGAAREGEIGVRLAVGAGRARVVRQLLIETSIIAAFGSMLAFVATRWTARFIEWLMPYPLAVSIQPDVNVLVFALVIGVATSVVFGVAPALRATRIDLVALLRAGAVGVASDRGRLRNALIVAQIALSFVLLGAGGLLARSVQRANGVDPGFRTTDVLIGALDVHTGDSASSATLARRLEQIAARAASAPGVLGAALASSVPATGGMSNRWMWRADVGRGDAGRGERPPTVLSLVVDTGYFHTMDVPILRGRAFDATLDPAGRITSVVINEALAKRLWPGEDALGREIAFGSLSGERRATVVGIARDARNLSLRAPAAPQAYLLLSQNPAGRTLLHVRVRPGQEVTASLSADLRALTPGSPPIQFRPAREWLAIGYADVRLISVLGAVFGALALMLATAGIYGVVSYETARRRREYGVRLALGARASQVHAMVLRRSTRLSAIGIAIGILGFAAAGPLLESWTFGISPLDPLTLVSIAAVLFLAGAVAAFAPAVRAARSDPIDSLRAE